MKKPASNGDKIKWTNQKHGLELKGLVGKTYDNSVLVYVDNHEIYAEYEIHESTVVNHKRYEVIAKANVGK